MCECLLALFVQSSGHIHRKIMVCNSEEGAGEGGGSARRVTTDYYCSFWEVRGGTS